MAKFFKMYLGVVIELTTITFSVTIIGLTMIKNKKLNSIHIFYYILGVYKKQVYVLKMKNIILTFTI